MNGGARLERRLILVLAGLLLATFAFLAGDRRMMRGHDHFFVYALTWFGTCHSVGGEGGAAYWLPYLAQGSEAGSGVPGALLVPSFFPAAGPLFEGVNVLTLHYAWILLQEIFFAAGIWLLARRWFRNPWTVFFVAATAALSQLWIDQPIPFTTVLPIPLLLLWGHEFLETGKRSRLLLSAILLSITACGTYNVLMVAICVAAYFAAHAFLFRKSGSLGWRRTDPLWLAGIVAVLRLPWLVHERSSELVGYSAGRDAGGSVLLDDFLTYGGFLNPLRFLDLAAGASPGLDAGVFAGAATVVLAVAAVGLRPRKSLLPIIVAFLFALVFSMGYLGAVAFFSYAWVPKLTLLRHVSWAGAVAKLLLVFLAGHGLEAVRRRGPRGAAWGALSVAALLGALACLPAEKVLRVLETGRRGYSIAGELAEGPWTPVFLGSSAAVLAVVGGILFRGRPGPRGVALLVALQVVHLAGWRMLNLQIRTVRLSPEVHAFHEARPLPYLPRRTSDSPRRKALEQLWPYGAESGGGELFLLVDPPAPRGRHVSWQRPLDDLMRCWAGPAGPGFEFNRLQFPSGHPAIPRVIGLSTDKLQVFRRAVRLASDERIAACLRDPAFCGDLLFVRGEEEDKIDLGANERRDAPCEVLAFDADRIVVRVEGAEGEWLGYADVWHPGWTATVNGAPAAVERANLAYKAVALRAGPNRVEFRFEPGLRRRAARLILAALSIWGLGVLSWIAATAVSARKGL